MIIPNLTFVFDRKKVASNKGERRGVVELLISYGTKRKYMSTGVRLLPREWKNGSVVARDDWRSLNEQLQVMKRKVSDIVTQMMDEGQVDIGAIPGRLQTVLVAEQTFIEYSKEIAKRREMHQSDGTKEHYRHYFEYMEAWKGIVYFSDINERNVMKLDDDLKSRGLKQVSRWSYHKKLKMFIAQAMEDGLVKRNPYSRLDIRRGDSNGIARMLTPDEFHRLQTAEMPSESLEQVRDVFVFQTLTLMAYCDLAEFNAKKCSKVDGVVVYKSNRQKTKQEFVAVLRESALEILAKYKNKLPIISNAKYNLYLKAVAQHAGIKKPITTHYARHTGATLLLNEGGVPMHIIQRLLGHASIRETEKTYAKLMDDTIVKAVCKL